MIQRATGRLIALILAAAGPLAAFSHAVVYSVTVEGTDAIFLAGRTDIVVPDPGLDWNGPGDHLLRHGGPTPEEAKETMPPWVSVAGGDVVKVADPAVGGINFFNGSAGGLFGPEGNSALTSSTIAALGGISGYKGTQGALVGLFLSAAIPSIGPAPATLDFAVLGIDFLSLSPALGQVFFIGDGQTSGGDFHSFTAPAGATRLYLGVPDAFGFNGNPGAYDDNDGSYRIKIGVNEDPRNPPTSRVPEGGPTLFLLAAGLASLALTRTRGR